ncbi:MAG: SDR family NAD(P)-dependent oxidoreductase [Clostridia bacterium]|nr:SDR family NAD(P)-dependent oxidoreductase [Clostridia bacterium]
MDQYFNGKVAVVTGAAGMICSAVAKDLASLGITTVLVGRTLEKLDKVAEEIRAAGGTCATFACDVTDEAAVNALADEVIARFGRCDYLINGAGGNNAKAQPKITQFDPRELEADRPEELVGLYNVDMQAFENVIKLNTMGTVYPLLAFAKYMTKQGGGSIVNFASMNTYCPLTRNFAYAMSKAAVANFTQAFAAYFAHTGVRVNAVAPGFIANERSKLILGTPETGLTKRGQDVIDHTPMQRFGQASDMCGAIRWLIDDRAASFVTGITVPVDGGFLTLSGV